MIKKAWIIAAKDIREVLRSRTTYLYMGVMMLISFSFFSGLSGTLGGASRRGVAMPALMSTAETAVGILISTLPLVFNMLFSSFLSNYAVITDKTKRVLESLLATPLTLNEVWAGKSLAITLPSISVSFVLSIAALILLNKLFIVPVVGTFVMPGTTQMITGWVLVPIISLLVTMIVTLFQLILNNPRIANFAFMIMFFAVFWIPTTPLMSSLNMPGIYLVLIAVLVVLILVLSRLLTKERVILSSKG
jgi:ABC-type Na+ efflux pump permease subunit